MTSAQESTRATGSAPEHVNLPSPTVWPLLLALGLTLAATGLLASTKVSWIGGLVALAGCIGWIFQVFPHERHVEIAVVPNLEPVSTSRREVAHIEVEEVPNRARLPLQIYPISAGIKGGVAGSVAMAGLAILYGLISYRSIWYPINLLGGVVYAETQLSTAWLTQFHIELFVVAAVLHVTGSILVGLLYGAMLPMLPRRPILLGGIVAPLFWTGLLYAVLGIVNLLLNARIDWRWFFASQVAFGIVAGFVVTRQVLIPTWQFPLSPKAWKIPE